MKILLVLVLWIGFLMLLAFLEWLAVKTSRPSHTIYNPWAEALKNERYAMEISELKRRGILE